MFHYVIASNGRVEVWLYDHNWDDIDYATHVFLNLNTVARKFVVGAAFHCYGGDVSAQSVFHERV